MACLAVLSLSASTRAASGSAKSSVSLSRASNWTDAAAVNQSSSHSASPASLSFANRRSNSGFRSRHPSDVNLRPAAFCSNCSVSLRSSSSASRSAAALVRSSPSARPTAPDTDSLERMSAAKAAKPALTRCLLATADKTSAIVSASEIIWGVKPP